MWPRHLRHFHLPASVGVTEARGLGPSPVRKTGPLMKHPIKRLRLHHRYKRRATWPLSSVSSLIFPRRQRCAPTCRDRDPEGCLSRYSNRSRPFVFSSSAHSGLPFPLRRDPWEGHYSFAPGSSSISPTWAALGYCGLAETRITRRKVSVSTGPTSNHEVRLSLLSVRWNTR